MTATTVYVQNCLDRLRGGDASAYDELIERSQSRLFLLSKRMFGDFSRLQRYQDAEDLYQQGILRLAEALKAEVPRDAQHFFKLATLQIRRQLIDLARKHFGPQGGGRNERSWPRPGNDESNSWAPAANTEQLGLWQEFHEAVDKLGDKERQAFELIWYQELAHHEVAAIMEVTERQVRRYWQSSRLKLHSYLQEWLPE